MGSRLEHSSKDMVFHNYLEAKDFLSSLNRPLVFTNGVFDILHSGHVDYLEKAATLGEALVVGINSDTLVRTLGKGLDRPIVAAYDRAGLVAALSCVACVIIFDDTTPESLLCKVQPEIYTKGGDYTENTLPEAALVKRWGGRTNIVDFQRGYSSSKIINKIRKQRKAAFIDRDGVINVDKGYVNKITEFEYMPGAISGLRELHELGFEIIIVTNQSGIARGYYTEEQFNILSDYVEADLKTNGVPILETFYCPHHPDATVPEYKQVCRCRKPEPGMILDAAIKHGILISESILIGDKDSDMAAGRQAGIESCFLIDTGDSHGLCTSIFDVSNMMRRSHLTT